MARVMSDAEEALQLSAAIMTKNSMATLPACIRSLQFCDEILPVDDESSDGTWDYLQEQARDNPKIRPVRRKLDSFVGQRRFMASTVRGRWILIVDADEEALPGLGEEIRRLLASEPATKAFHVPQHNVLPQHWAKSVSFWTSQKRLFRVGDVHWADSDWVHTPSKHSGRAGRLKHGLKHHSYDSMMHLLKKQLYYGASGGDELCRRGKPVSLAGMCLRMLSNFFKHYVGKGLWLQGFGGFAVSFAMAFYTFAKYSFAWEGNAGKAANERQQVPGEAGS